MKIIIGSDHAGVEYKSKIVKFFKRKNHTLKDVGTHTKDKVDYPEYAHLVAENVLSGADFGILICGSGNGVSMAANKHKGVRAAICWNKEIAKLARNHNNANIISIPARFITLEESIDIISIFIKEGFDGGRHTKRVNKI
jgi:ribose 5-phosphate isomerase B